ncbi:MAG: ribonucleoside triphosphate reductase, partial [Oscillospiraceae bacterium]|nr:ribonucleoside triphosphate reductase [Oscillospiraceae bacterium]
VKKIAENYELPYYTLSPTYSVCADHGYLAGEQYTCPICGRTTEVYSRITGYYRPVQNWNDGKSQEFADRKNYVIGDLPTEAAAPAAQEQAAPAAEDKLLLFVTDKCPNCGVAKPMLAEAGIEYEIVNVSENRALAKSLKLMQAPSLVAYQDGKPTVYAGLAGITKYIQTR